jgi:G3E family GTPase
MARTPVALVTGFLGSGKTTLINRLLGRPGMADTAVIVNEFGTIGIDHDLIAASDDAIVLLANGCLCCAVRGDLVRTLDELHRGRAGGALPPFARVLIETSGLADPSPVTHALLAEPTLRARYVLGGIVTLVDAVNGAATIDTHREASKQVALADRIVITKLDLAAGAASEAALRERIAAVNPAADVDRAPAQPDPEQFFGARSPEDAPAGIEAWLKSDRYLGDALRSGRAPPPHAAGVRSFCVVRDEPFTEGMLRLFADALSQCLGPALLRVKGIVAVAERPDTPAVLHGAQALLHDVTWLPRWPSDDRRTRIVVITLDHEQQEIEELLDLARRMSAGAARARTAAVPPRPGTTGPADAAPARPG